MSTMVLWYRTRFARTEPGADPEQAAERYWEEVDRRYEESRDDQVLSKAADLANEHGRRQQP